MTRREQQKLYNQNVYYTITIISMAVALAVLYLLFNNVVKAGIFSVCQLMPILLLIFNKRSLNVVKSVCADLSVAYAVTTAVLLLVQLFLNLQGVDKFLLCYLFTCIFYIESVYLICNYYNGKADLSADVGSIEKQEYYLIFSKFSSSCLLAHVAGYISMLGYFGFDKWFVNLVVILVIGVITNTSFYIAVSLAIVGKMK